MTINLTKVKKVVNLGKQKETVYDIGVDDNTPYFFANDILVHNSVYFSLDTALKRNKKLKEKFENFEFSKENIIKYYDNIAEEVNRSFNNFLKEAFNVEEKFAVIRAGRELVASSGLFVTKKRYAVLMYDKEGVRLDKNGEPGKVKAMGLDLKRSDTPEYVQKFLEEILLYVLTGKSKDYIFEKIREFKKNFKQLKPWEKGVPKRVNGLTEYYEKYERIKKTFTEEEFVRDSENKNKSKKKEVFAVPGHVMASINYNKLRSIFNDTISMEIQDGAKIIVCKLKSNSYKMNSIAYPIDMTNLPNWFKQLPFDEEDMEKTVVDKKISNLLEVMNWDLSELENNNSFDDFFSF